MKKYLFLFFAFFFSIVAYAQLEVKPDSFKEVPGFVNINTDIYEDDNNVLYAVIKVNTENINDKERHQLLFQGNAATFIELEYKVGEVWVYLSSKPATYLKISHPDFGSTEFWFPFDLEPKKGYEMVLVNKAFQLSGIGYITVTSTPKGADVFVDNERVGVTPYLSEVINVGNHKISVSLDGYKTVAKRIVILNGNEEELEFNLVPEANNKDMPHASTKQLNGKFSVSPGKQVVFSQGNLQYNAAKNVWKFAENQWDYIGLNNRNISSSYDGWIDLFGWGTSGYNNNNPYYTSSESKDYAMGKNDISNTNYDWGVYCKILNGGGKKWRTLTSNEWMYLIKNRGTKSGILYAKAEVDGVNGVILLPDDWSENNYHLNNPNNKSGGFHNNRISKNDWNNLFEKHGAVFIPAAGVRTWDSVDFVGTRCSYWTASHCADDRAYCVGFLDGVLYQMSYYYTRSFGNSVRLVYDSE